MNIWVYYPKQLKILDISTKILKLMEYIGFLGYKPNRIQSPENGQVTKATST